MSRAPGSGSRARSREIGYAEAMGEIGFMLRDEARRWENTAGQQIDPVARAALNVAGRQLREIADFALGTYELHLDPDGDFARNVEHRARLEANRHVPAGPRELPRNGDAS